MNFRTPSYTYYVTGASEANGLTGDLKTAVRQFWDRGAWKGGDTYYYRYYTEPAGAHLLKMAFSRQGYADAKAVYSDLTGSNVSDEKLLRFSRRYYVYNRHRQVVRAVLNGRYKFRYEYQTRDPASNKKGAGDR